MSLTKVQSGVSDVQAAPFALGVDCKNNAGTPNTQFDLDADVITLRKSDGGTVVRFNPGAAITNNISTAGPVANGRDQAGAFTVSTFIHFYWIWNGAILATLSSASASAPTLPAAYTHFAYAGAVKLDGSGSMLKVRIKGETVYYEAAQNILAGGTQNTETAVDTSSFVPANALDVLLNSDADLTSDGVGAASALAILRLVTGATVYAAWFIRTQAASQTEEERGHLFLPNIGQNIYYQWGAESANIASHNLDLNVLAYKIPNGG